MAGGPAPLSNLYGMDRRAFLRASAVAAARVTVRLPGRKAVAAPNCEPGAPFNPMAWCAERGLGPLTSKSPQRNLPFRPIVAQDLAAWQKERKKYLNAFREMIGPWPARPALSAASYDSYDDPDFTRVRVSFQSLSGDPFASTIKSWLFLPKGYSTPRPAIVTLHQTVPQGKDEPAGVNATLPWLTFAEYYARRGYVTLAPDAIGYGERTKGCYAEQSFELADAWSILQPRPQMSLLGLMLFDVTRAVDYLQTRGEVDPNRIGVMGHSQGGFLTNMVLGLEPRFRVGVASCGYGLFRYDLFTPDRWAGPQSAYLPRMIFYGVNRNALPFDFHQIMALAAPAAHLVQTAMLDTIWTPSAVVLDPLIKRELKRVHGFYGSKKNYVSLEESGDHGWYPDAQIAADALFDRILKP
jgi:dienelactone hydrolase